MRSIQSNLRLHRLRPTHDEERLELEAFKMRPQTVCIVMFPDVHQFLCAGHHIQRCIVITSVPQHHQPSVNSLQDQVKGQVPIGHGND